MLFIAIHRHIGGLEKFKHTPQWYQRIHRHIGGLEIGIKLSDKDDLIHRHIGGLEKNQLRG